MQLKFKNQLIIYLTMLEDNLQMIDTAKLVYKYTKCF